METILAAFLNDAVAKEDVAEAEAFVREHLADLVEVAKKIDQAFAAARTNLNWMENNYGKVVAWLRKRSSSELPSWR